MTSDFDYPSKQRRYRECRALLARPDCPGVAVSDLLGASIVDAQWRAAPNKRLPRTGETPADRIAASVAKQVGTRT